jgi:hypothetical protein
MITVTLDGWALATVALVLGLLAVFGGSSARRGCGCGLLVNLIVGLLLITVGVVLYMLSPLAGG